MIRIVDYGMGNLRSVEKAVEKVGGAVEITSDPDAVAKADKLILPGVGAMRDAMAHLREANLIEPIKEFVKGGNPFLGICLGLQMLFDRSYEYGTYEGLGIIPGEVVRFEIPAELKVPHMGWNRLNVVRRPPLLEGLPESPHVYFVHSYYVAPQERSVVATETEYGVSFTSMVWKENVFATQFHPEKSQRVGLGILENFVTRV
ncbi:Imidazole glycerol phosphate synthase subunit HisH 1 [Planctomycetes bacterium Pan216]|uniref:Imidazole glycerol phosphate synthase subunit HisH n=1 Tax=Kolteria novifilia TaxID=2527975 RepID=A0A518AWV3_9BACT|nr:Imidazole glycerol phosphate synthase subunit HisH 1 [Planctomycetes bacterium Pan216]